MQRTKMLAWGAIVIAAMSLAGCGEQAKHVKEISKPAWTPKLATWPEYEALNFNVDPDATSLSKIRRQMNESEVPGTICDARIGVNNPKFVEIVATFEKTPIPAEFATPEREASKKELIETIQKLQKGCKSKIAEKEQKELFQKALAAMEKVAEIPGQTRPTGSEAARYAPEK